MAKKKGSARKASAKPSSAASKKATPETSSAGIFNSFTSMRLADRIAWGALLLIALIVPLITASRGSSSLPLTYDQFDVMKVFVLRGLSLVALGAWAWSFFVDNKSLRFSPVFYLVLAFLAWVTLSTIFADFTPVAIFGKYRRFEGLITFANYAILFFLYVQYLDSISRIRVLAKTAFISFFLVSFYGVLQALGADPINWGTLPFEQNRAFSTYGNPDLLGGALVLAIPISISLALTEKDSLYWRAFFWVGFLLNWACLIASFVRGAWIAAIVGMVITVIILIIQRPKFKTLDWSFIGLTGVTAGGLIVASLTRADDVMNAAKRFASIFETESGSGFTRLEIWKAAASAIKDRPFLGHGADTFRLLFPKYKTLDYVHAAGYKSVADNVHNYILQLATGIGIVGVALMYGIFIWVAVVAGKLVFTKRRPRTEAILLGGFWVACASYLVHLFFGISVAGTTFFLWASLAALIAPSARSIELKPKSWGVVGATAVILVCLAGSFFNIQFVRADHAYLMSKVYQGQKNFPAALEEANKAIALSPYNDIYRAEPGMVYRAMGSESQNGTEAIENIQLAIDSFEDVIAFCPLEYDNYIFLASSYNSLAQAEISAGKDPTKTLNAALDASERAIKVEPYGPLARLQLAQTYAMLGEKDKAREAAESALEIDPNFADAQTFLSQLNGSRETTQTTNGQ